MANWSTLHIFEYGETQLIGKDFNKKVPSTVLTTLTDVVNNVYSFKPEGNEATEEYHAINIFNTMFSDWQPKSSDAKGWRTEYAELDATAIDALVAEIEAYVIPEVVAPIAE
jgi:hypothetical protein